jgi:hypothetical protein
LAWHEIAIGFTALLTTTSVLVFIGTKLIQANIFEQVSKSYVPNRSFVQQEVNAESVIKAQTERFDKIDRKLGLVCQDISKIKERLAGIDAHIQLKDPHGD